MGSAEAAVHRLCGATEDEGTASRWQSLYFFQDVPDESLICVELVPRMLDELSQGSIDAFFYIRYWTGGFHWRLRFRSEDPDASQRLHRDVTKNGAAVVASRPGAYEREIDRYGGPGCIGTCEAHFMLSSLNAWRHLAGNLVLSPDEITRRVRLPRAAEDMMMTVGLAYEKPGTAMSFLRAYWRGWLVPREIPPRKSVHAIRLELEREMERQFTLLGAALKEHLVNQWRVGKSRTRGGGEEEGAAPHLGEATWRRGSEAVVNALRTAGLDFTGPSGHRAMSGLIHMNNNRLGVGNRDEAFLAYVCERTLQEIAS